MSEGDSGGYEMNITFVTFKTQFEGVHCYPDAPSEVCYLRNPHRHMFYVEVEMEVFHDDREVEFIMAKHRLEEFIETDRVVNFGTQSCEMIAKEIQTHFKKLYPIPNSQTHNRDPYSRLVNVRVSEDGENGVYLMEVRNEGKDISA